MSNSSVMIRIGGEGGEGVISTGELLSKAASRAGHSIMTYRIFPAEIKGGLAQFQMRLSDRPLKAIATEFDHLMAFNQEALDAFHDTVAEGGRIYFDPSECDLEGMAIRAETIPVPLNEIAKEHGGTNRGKNMVALGFLARIAGLDLGVTRDLLTEKFRRKGEKILAVNIACLEAGHEIGAKSSNGRAVLPTPPNGDGKSANGRGTIVISGNEATALGAIAAGCRYMAGYPITPASSILETMSRHLPRFGGTVVQCEDEIAALASCLGASYAGEKAMTATSGPGIMLMTELITLASTQELPVVVIDVQRGGPSTGLPTKQEQSDLKFAIYGSAGEVPRIIVAPSSVEECFHLTARAFNLAERYQLPVIILSDTSLAFRTETIPEPDLSEVVVENRLQPTEAELVGYQRYRDTPTGVSPVAIPGVPGGLHIAGGLEHDEDGSPCYTGSNHNKMNAKRFRKLETLKENFDEWVADFEIVDNAALGIVGWGSTKGAIAEAIEMAAERGIKVSHFHPRIVSPLPERRLRRFLAESPIRRVLVVEENFTGQFSHFLKAKFDIKPIEVLKAEGVPFTPAEILDAIVKAEAEL
jgi:2-oxoglutarate/2-oxoacid ferredoxin oxidoreductase subunit alpha